LKEFDEESQKILLSYQNKIISEDMLMKNNFQNTSVPQSSPANQASNSVENINWETDEYFNLKLLVAKIKFAQSGSRDYLFEYNIQSLESNISQKSVNDGKNSYIRLKVYRNPRLGNVSVKWNDVRVVQEINTKKKIVYYKLYFHYTDLSEIAFILETTNYQEFRNLNILLGYGDIDDYDEDYNYFLKNFTDSLKKDSSPDILKFLYENIPESLLVNISSLIDSNLIFDHLYQLTEYDDTGFFSGWQDGSSAIVNNLRCIDPIFLLNEFKKKPNLCNRIYYNLDMSSKMEGEMMPNRIIFATILMQYCLFSHNRPKENSPTFTIGKDYKVATKITELGGDFFTFGKSDQETFFLQQQQEYIVEEENYETDDLGVSTIAKSNSTKTLTKDLDDGGQYFPIDMVFFIDRNTGSETSAPVPAIYVKALADLEKWENINKTIRIVADILGTTLGIGTLLLTGNPYIALAAAADLALSGMDLTVHALRVEIAKLEGGEQFLKEWDIIYNNGGFIIATPQLVAGIFKSIFSLIPKAAVNVRQGLKAMAISVFLDLNSGIFQRKELRLFEATEWITPSAGFFSKTKECEILLENGAFFMELDAAIINGKIAEGINPDIIGTITNKRKFGLVYQGEIVAQGNRYDKVYRRVLMDLKKAINNGNIRIILEELKKLAFCEKTPKITNKYPTENLPIDGLILNYNFDSKGIFRQLNGNLFPSREFDFIITKSGDLKIGKKHHLLGNKDEVLAAGQLRFKNGRIVELDNLSGHYRPTSEEAQRLGLILTKIGIPIKRARNEIVALSLNNNGEIVRNGKDKIIYIENIK
ncbi:hypothetical protein, partial [Chryseobacterium sp.]|uniref:hypothetical protein n=1 Tax=Chryseobacterium sp. TaxID=1871047 RepID=UPI0025C21721